MADTFSATLTEDQLIRLLRDGFGNALAKTLGDEIVDSFKEHTEKELEKAETMIRDKVKHVVSQYVAKAVSISNDPASLSTVINIHITKKGE